MYAPRGQKLAASRAEFFAITECSEGEGVGPQSVSFDWIQQRTIDPEEYKVDELAPHVPVQQGTAGQGLGGGLVVPPKRASCSSSRDSGFPVASCDSGFRVEYGDPCRSGAGDSSIYSSCSCVADGFPAGGCP